MGIGYSRASQWLIDNRVGDWFDNRVGDWLIVEEVIDNRVNDWLIIVDEWFYGDLMVIIYWFVFDY